MSDTTESIEYRDIVKDIEALSAAVSPAGEGASALAETLFDHLDHYGGIGLAANQIGIDQRVCVVDVIEPFYLVNPEIVDAQGETPFVEACLSFPGEPLNTRRHVRVTVEADNYASPLTFGPNPEGFSADTVDDLDDPELLESVAVQHEIDHLNGVTFHTREVGRGITFQRDERSRYGRNDLVVITHEADDGLGTIMEVIKWKYRSNIGDAVEWDVQGPAPDDASIGVLGHPGKRLSEDPVSVFER